MNDKILYLECASGISGDMTVAALLDLGADEQKLRHALASMKLDGFDIRISRVTPSGMAACDFDVHEHHHHHHHDTSHSSLATSHSNHHHKHEHRNLDDVYAIIDRADITAAARALAKKIFLIVAESEAKAHGTSIDRVHFHEVGAIDSIVDIVAVAVCIDDLGITRTIITGISEGTGTIACQHGLLPVPVPAVLNIAAAHNLPLRVTDELGEMVTPTGAAIAAALRTDAALPEHYTISKIGIGAGKRRFTRPNLLRAMLIRETALPESAATADSKWLLETNIDDATGEQLGLAMERLFAAGAVDVHYSPVFMKKNRPGWLLRVIADAARVPDIERVIFRETTTIGIRKIRFDRTIMTRERITVSLPEGDVDVKKCTFADIVKFAPEYESVCALADKTGTDFTTLYSQAKTQAETR